MAQKGSFQDKHIRVIIVSCTHWWIQTRASPGIARVKFRSIVVIAYRNF